MNRMQRILPDMKKRGEKILVSYFPLADTIFDNNDAKWAKKYFANGATVLEMGLPYENPALDGKTVRESMERALSHCTTNQAFDIIKDIRKECPDNILQVMTYYGNIEKYGIADFARRCADCGADAVLAPDTPREKYGEMDTELGKRGLIFLRFAPYNLTDDIIEDVQANAKGYIFQQAVDGVTGVVEGVSEQVEKNIRRLREAGVTTPVIAGFGISSPEQIATALKMGADGVVVGSAIVSHIMNGDGEAYIASLRAALDR